MVALLPRSWFRHHANARCEASRRARQEGRRAGIKAAFGTLAELTHERF